MIHTKKSLSAPIGVLLILLAVIVLFFILNYWVMDKILYSFQDVEENYKSNKNINLNVLGIESNNLYIKNNYKNNYNIRYIFVDENQCIAEDINLSLGINIIDVSDCINNTLANHEYSLMINDDIINSNINIIR